MKERQTRGNGTAILYEADLGVTPEPGWFQPDWWAGQDKAGSDLGGRGRALIVETPLGRAVLRRFCRGGLMQPILQDRYLRAGADQSRSFREFRVLAELRAQHLPVPEPLAASYEPVGLIYRAGLLTRLIPDSCQLAEVAGDMPGEAWSALGATLRRFFRAGLMHPDLNARNILVDQSGRWYLLDLDRARILDRAAPGRGMLARLERSLEKVVRPGWRPRFEAHVLGSQDE